MNNKPNVFIDFQTICRMCLEENSNMISIFEKHIFPDYKSYSEMLEECASVNVSEDDLLPKNICTPCSEQLIQSYKLKIQCVTSEKMLLQFIENAQSEVEIEEHFIYDVKTIYEYDEKKDELTEIKEEYLEEFETKEFECKECSIGFPSEVEYLNHVKFKHSKIKCEYCVREFSSFETLAKHLNSSHKFCCKVCTKIFTNKNELKQHVTDNLCTTTSFTCNQCDKTFKNSNRYKIHMRIHTGDKRFYAHIVENHLLIDLIWLLIYEYIRVKSDINAKFVV
ncbi:zinc finger protein 891-like [Chrysoperla carnea]|uniref:zinc finger protein 891-like n=1 Tax=Chrysoperla carnea TaxID=189513 RepID=UPI001D06B7BF|nr:zinc finger protein 891-like [Chrysoperla carnea]